MNRAYRSIVTVVWKLYCVVYFRWAMLKHFLKGDIKLGTFLTILLPPGKRPAQFDYFDDLPGAPPIL